MSKRAIAVGIAALFAGAAQAGPLANLVGGLLSPLQGASAGTSPAQTQVQMPGLPVVGALTQGLPILSRNTTASSTAALPGLGALNGVAGISVLKNGADGSGYGYVLKLSTIPIIGSQLNGVLVTPLLGLPSQGGLVDGGVLNGNATANAGSQGLLGFALISGSNNGNGGAAGLGVLNGNTTGNGSLLGLAALSGANAGSGSLAGIGILNRGSFSGTGGLIGLGVLSGQGSGTGTLVGVGLLNSQDGIHLCFAGNCISPTTIAGMASALPIPQSTILPGIVIGDSTAPVVSSNPLLNVGLLSGTNSGTGGALGIGALAGSNSGQGSVAGACVLCGNNSGQGPLGVAVLSGNNSGTGMLGVGALVGNASGNGSILGTGVLTGDGSGNGSVIGAGVLGGVASGNGGTLGAGVLNGSGSGNGGTIGAGVLNGAGSANGGLIGAGVINGNRTPSNNNAPSGTAPVAVGLINSQSTTVATNPPGTTSPINTGGANVPTTLGDLFDSNAADETLCTAVGRNANDKSKPKNKELPCNRLKTSRVASN